MILEECRAIAARQEGCATGEAVITTGGSLRARHVIHTVGLVWSAGRHGEERLLRSAYRKSLALAAAKGLCSVAFPSIATGAYRFPIAQAAAAAIDAVARFLTDEFHEIQEVRFVTLFRRQPGGLRDGSTEAPGAVRVLLSIAVGGRKGVFVRNPLAEGLAKPRAAARWGRPGAPRVGDPGSRAADVVELRRGGEGRFPAFSSTLGILDDPLLVDHERRTRCHLETHQVDEHTVVFRGGFVSELLGAQTGE